MFKRLNLLFVGVSVVVAFHATSSSALAQDRTLEEFREYATERLEGQLDEKQITKFVEMVDANSDGTISEDEFENRMDVLQSVMAGDTESDDDSKKDNAKDKGNEKKQSDSNADRNERFKRMNERMQAQLEEAGIVPGKPLPDVAGLDIDGSPFDLSSLKGGYSVIVSGCLT